MSLDAYRMAREDILSNPIDEMRRIKHKQIEYLYGMAPDREYATLNGNEFHESPRIFDKKTVDEVHKKITVETRIQDDWFGCGDYLYYEDAYWLCVEAYVFHGMYCRGTFEKCNWELFWIDTDGNIQSQWCVNINTTQYNSGEYSDKYMTTGSSQHQLKMQCNERTVQLASPTRVFLDKNLKSPACFKVTQNDNSAYNYDEKGLCVITVLEHGRNTEKDKLVTLEDGRQVWIADYFEKDTVSEDGSITDDSISASIQYIYRNLYIGRKATYTAKFSNADGEIIDIVHTWTVVCDFVDAINIEQSGSTVTLLITDRTLEGQTFTLQLSNEDSTATASLDIYVDSLI